MPIAAMRKNKSTVSATVHLLLRLSGIHQNNPAISESQEDGVVIVVRMSEELLQL